MISIIIPAYNEENKIGKLVTYLKLNSDPVKTEIIVVDGGSKDGTIAEAEKSGAVVITSPKKGRAGQMNFGAANATGEVLYFVHADTIPPVTFVRDIEREISKGVDCGCFRLQFDIDHQALRFYAWFTRFDIDFFRFGDQSLFVKKKIFRKIGGFDEELIVMEDQDIVKRLKDHAQFRIINHPVVTSARKYEHIGVFKLQFIFSIIVCLFYLKISQETILHFYQAVIDS